MKKLIEVFGKDGVFLLAISFVAVAVYMAMPKEEMVLEPVIKEAKVASVNEIGEVKNEMWRVLMVQRDETIAKRLEEEARIAEINEKVKTAIANYTSSETTQDYIYYAWETFPYYGWEDVSELECLITLWHRESKWQPLAHNPSSGAHGIPQSLPASKMARFGDDYWDNGYTQIEWGLWYIWERYGNPSNALAHSNRTGWY